MNVAVDGQKKLSEQELVDIRRWSEADEQFGIQELAELHVKELLGHIDALEAEHLRALQALRDDSVRQGDAVTAFIARHAASKAND